MKWEVMFPPYGKEDLYHLDYPPPGAYKFATGKGSAFKTLQVLGGSPEKDIDVDLGWAQVHISAKGKNLTMTFGGGKEAIDKRWDEEKKLEAEAEANLLEARLARESLADMDAYDNMPEEITEKIPKGEPPIGLRKVEMPQYQAGRVKVYVVNGEYVRNNLDVDFTQGGHWKVYPEFIPKNEVWIDGSLDTFDRKATVLHELAEVRDMGSAIGKDEQYEDSHNNVANPLEIQARQNPHNIDDMIREELTKFEARKNRVKAEPEPEYDQEEVVVVPSYVRRKKIGSRPQESIGDKIATRTYLGRKIDSYISA
jgi:hypothetical protein